MKFHLIPEIPNTKNWEVGSLTTLELIPTDLVDMFGKPCEGDGCKVSGVFIFTNGKGDVFTIYDWKTTTLYHGEDSECLTPEEFWQEYELYTFNIGGNNKKLISAFLKWLSNEFEKPKLPVIKRIKPLSDAQLLPAYMDGKYGYIDIHGEMVFAPVFDEANAFSEELSLVRIENRFGYINRSGEFVIQPIYENAESFREGIAFVKRGRKRFFIDSKEEVTFKIGRSDFYRISEGLICIRGPNKKWGYVDKFGATQISCQFGLVMPFSEGLAYVSSGMTYGYIDKQGNMVFQAPYRSGSFSEGYATCRIKRKYGFIDKSGNQVIPAKFDDVRFFRENMAAVRVKEKWGYIDTKGNFVIEPQFENVPLSVLPFSEGLACIKFDKLFGFIDKTGQMVIPPVFRVPCSFSNGIAGYAKLGYINKEGQFIWRPNSN